MIEEQVPLRIAEHIVQRGPVGLLVVGRIEEMLGLSKTPTSAPVVPELVYDGPPSGDTPTVEQFLNASADAYVLGGQPGDLKPFTVNGFQMQTFNPLSGAVGKAWVTPEGQIIVAYQGTTGGTNLLFHPLIAISQIITDMQIIFTNTTPQAFWDSLAFERKVEAAALEQGYTTDDISDDLFSLEDTQPLRWPSRPSTLMIFSSRTL